MEYCTCNAICPCWLGENPDGDFCYVAVAWHFNSGNIDGVDVSGLTIGAVADVPNNILDGGWRVVVAMDEKASTQQEEALLSVYTGQQGGPVADIAKLIGEVVAVERVPIVYEGAKGKGTLKMGTAVDATMVPYLDGAGQPTMLHNSVFSSVGGAPVYVGKAPIYKVNRPELGINVDMSDHNVVQGNFPFEA